MTLPSMTLARALAIALCMLGASLPAGAEVPSKLDKILRASRAKGAVQRVIIQTRGSRAALRRTLERHGDVVQAEHPGLNALTVLLHAEDLTALDADRSVLAVSVDADVTAFGAPRASRHSQRGPGDEAGSLRHTLGLSTVPFAGTGVAIAVVDSGIDPARDLEDNIAGFWDFTRGGARTRPHDDYGHGTHVAGLIAGGGAGSRGAVAGVAPAARLYGFKVLDKNGRGRASHVIQAIEFIVANRRSAAPGAFKVDVINLSLGHPIYEPARTDPLVRAVENAVRAGIVVVTAAGNLGGSEGDTGYTGITSPGNAPSAITVGAADSRETARIADDRIAAFSSRGPTWFDGYGKPDLVAPGVNLTSEAPPFAALFQAYPTLRRLSKSSHGYGTLSGTSMAAAVATGVASLVLDASRTANPGGSPLTPNALKAVLQYTAIQLRDDLGNTYDALTQGTGEVNPRGAVALALAIDTAIPAGAPWLRASPAPFTAIGGAVVPWSRALLWDDNIVWGTDALAFNSPQWADNIVWGTAVDAGDNIVWGTAADVEDIVWGNAVEWAADLVWRDRLLGLMQDDENIVWGTVAGLDADNIVWGTFNGENIVWGTWENENIVWGTVRVGTGALAGWVRALLTAAGGENIVWGTGFEGGR